MAEAHNTRQLLYDNLRDAECPADLTDECMALAARGQSGAMLQKLSGQRARLLDEIHRYQKALDCLDYLMFQIQKSN